MSSLTRRTLFQSLLALFTIPVVGEKICLTTTLNTRNPKCPLGHETCRSVDLPLVIGNDDHYFPNVAQVFEMRLLMCDICHVLFIDNILPKVEKPR